PVECHRRIECRAMATCLFEVVFEEIYITLPTFPSASSTIRSVAMVDDSIRYCARRDDARWRAEHLVNDPVEFPPCGASYDSSTWEERARNPHVEKDCLIGRWKSLQKTTEPSCVLKFIIRIEIHDPFSGLASEFEAFVTRCCKIYK